jgi:putative SOS response-associated peptidase YedK
VGLQERGWQAPLQCSRRKHQRRELLETIILTSPLLVPADSFFEWQKTEKGQKPKFEFTVLGSKPFGMTALWAP